MKLIIAEKPDQGSKLASPFSHQKKTGYIEISPNQVFPKGALCTWAVGHLCELVPPEEYDNKWKKWSLDALPIIPSKFNHRVSRSKWKQFNIIKGLVHRSDIEEIIIAGDAGREGEAIVRIILNLCKNNKRMKRLWISSLTPKAVTKGFENLLDEADTRNIYFEALSRSCADWLIGMNASRAYTLLLQQKGINDVFSTGRVQTPTLALIVKREKEINQFKQEDFWEVKATFKMDGKKYEGTWHKEKESRLKEKEMAERIKGFCIGKDATIQSIEKNRKEFPAPYLFNLSSLQATANKRFKFSPQQTLDVAQKLYVKGIISYPRSDSNFITKEEANMLPSILQKISEIPKYKTFFPLHHKSLISNKRFVNDKKVSDHYAIIPTEQVTDPTKLSNEEEKIYTLIVERLLSAHEDKAIVDYTTIHTLVDHRATFISKGKETVQEGWRRIIFRDRKQKDNSEEEEQDLPSLKEGEIGKVEDVAIKKGRTQPPKRYTEGELITLMKTAGKHLDDNELVKILNRTEGLGTEATRAGIIGVLKDRKYINVEKNQVSPTEKGKLLIDAVGSSILASPEMTAKWEQRLFEIGQGEASPNVFMEQSKRLTAKLIEDAIIQSKHWSLDSVNIDDINKNSTKTKGFKGKRGKGPIGKCKKCTDGFVVDKGSFYGCSNYSKTNCNFTISKNVLGKKLSMSNVKKLLLENSTNKLEGLKKGGKTFNAYLVWNTEKSKMEFKF
ncbi:DNA topoisomerase III [Evansella sp. AB-P1]|uniref:DNA topoisomerase III n=1 Tax=Evansella sp. AB-P1 TaxID=3037653 RepID=UPI00241BE71A|nr:DNA topoisomerase III [Evansella sp. AB-P1]MDG5789560.1 DNA topoisomerase III [Evansella sp. AB-P1]